MTSLRHITPEDAEAYCAFYANSFPHAQFYVVTYSGQIIRRGFESYMQAFDWAVDYQVMNPEDIVDVWVKVRETVVSALESMEREEARCDGQMG